MSDRTHLIKRDILQNRTFDFELLYYYNPEENNSFRAEFQTLGCRTPEEDENDLIIYTYDQFVHLEEERKNNLLRDT